MLRTALFVCALCVVSSLTTACSSSQKRTPELADRQPDRGSERVAAWRQARYEQPEYGPRTPTAVVAATADETDVMEDVISDAPPVAAAPAPTMATNSEGRQAFFVFTVPDSDVRVKLLMQPLADGRAGVPFALENGDETLLPLDVQYDELLASGGANLDRDKIFRPFFKRTADIEGNDVSVYEPVLQTVSVVVE